MLRVGFIGWRGMVGSVLMQRMREEKDFAGLDPVFFSTSNAGSARRPRQAMAANSRMPPICANSRVAKSSSAARAANTLPKSMGRCARGIGTGIGSMRPPHCA